MSEKQEIAKARMYFLLCSLEQCPCARNLECKEENGMGVNSLRIAKSKESLMQESAGVIFKPSLYSLC